jgi:integrase
MHRMAALPPPKSEQVRRLITGVQRLRGEHPAAKNALEFRDLQRICATLNDTDPYQIRTRAMLTLGFASALRRSNLVALELRDLEFTEEGLLVTVRREKQDQKAYGRIIGVPKAKDPSVCAVRSVQRWLAFRGDAAGPLLVRITDGQPVIVKLNSRNVAKAIKKCVAAIGLSPVEYSGHSLRAGLITEAFERGVGEIVIAAHTGHRSLSSLRRYFRRRDPFRANAYALLGL